MKVPSRPLFLLLTVAGGLALASQALPQPLNRFGIRAAPKLEPVAETRLLMEGLNQANFHGLERLLGKKPGDEEAWKFARGQALLIAETGNLLLLRPPRARGQDEWMDHATDLRDKAVNLARTLARRDYDGSRDALGDVANTCNSCHQTFRVNVHIVPFANADDRGDNP
jgi:hypothetical protein